jgi:transcriptional regulator with XRE-family HTH domain
MENEIYQKYEASALRHSLSLGELCDRAGVARSTVSRWNKGSTPWGSTLRKLDAAILALSGKVS